MTKDGREHEGGGSGWTKSEGREVKECRKEGEEDKEEGEEGGYRINGREARLKGKERQER